MTFSQYIHVPFHSQTCSKQPQCVNAYLPEANIIFDFTSFFSPSNSYTKYFSLYRYWLLKWTVTHAKPSLPHLGGFVRQVQPYQTASNPTDMKPSELGDMDRYVTTLEAQVSPEFRKSSMFLLQKFSILFLSGVKVRTYVENLRLWQNCHIHSVHCSASVKISLSFWIREIPQQYYLVAYSNFISYIHGSPLHIYYTPRLSGILYPRRGQTGIITIKCSVFTENMQYREENSSSLLNQCWQTFFSNYPVI